MTTIKQATTILRRLQAAMLLRDWKPWIDPDSRASEGASAQVFRRDDYYDARIRLGERLLEHGTEWHVTQALAHELAHLVLRDLHQLHERLVYDLAQPSTRSLLINLWSHEEEKVVDQLGRDFANLLVAGDEPDDHFPGFRDEDDD